jgi:hypothetical protein
MHHCMPIIDYQDPLDTFTKPCLQKRSLTFLKFCTTLNMYLWHVLVSSWDFHVRESFESSPFALCHVALFIYNFLSLKGVRGCYLGDVVGLLWLQLAG